VAASRRCLKPGVAHGDVLSTRSLWHCPPPSQRFPSTHFYEDTLKAAAGLNERTWAGSALRLHPYSCVNVDGVETKDGHSWKNETEVGVACLQQCVSSFSFEPWMPLGHRWSRWRRLSLDW
jgi:hypothetical protein